MRSPFPGMDPYLEQFWGDVHHRLITYLSDAIQRQLPADLRARVDERIYVEPEEGKACSIVPDVRIIERRRREAPTLHTGGAGIALAEPLVIHMEQDEPVRQGFIEIIDIKSGRRVVTVIEVLSPSNKVPGAGRDLYVKKQQELRAGNVSMVEIDLLRSGTRVLCAPFALVPEGYRTPYAACVRRAWNPSDLEYYPLSLRERLPAFGIPLRESDRDAPLDLQAAIDQCYASALYDDIDYREDPDPPLVGDDAHWADKLLREQGRR